MKATGALIYCTSTNRFLLQQRSPTESHPGTWGLWGGKAHQGERPIDTLLRECKEELGTNRFDKIVPIHQYKSRDGSFIYDCFCCLVSEEFVPKTNGETMGWAWVSSSRWPSPLHFKSKAMLMNKSFKKKLKNFTDFIHNHD